MSTREALSAGSIWERAAALSFASEADVEQWLVSPLLEALGYDLHEIRAKPPIVFREGRVGRRPEADFIVYHGPAISRETSLIVVEAKKPGMGLADARSQAESYAFNERAPFLLLTDGNDMEVWQLQVTKESQCVFTCKVAELAEHEGRIISLIGRDAAATHCRSLDIKPLPSPAGIYAGYHTAELQRLGGSESVARTLKGTSGAMKSTDIAVCLARSAIVTAPSGYGKSTLAADWHNAALALRLSSGNGSLSVDVQLPDVAADGGTIVDYALSRIRAQSPAVSKSTLLDSMRDDGVIFLCDRLDRVPSAGRAKIETELRNLLRDFPLCVFVIFDRNGTSTRLAIPQVALLELDDDQRRALAELVLGERGALGLHAIPNSLKPLASHPLLLRRLLGHYGATGQVQLGLSVLFEEWIDQLLERGSRPPTEYAALRQALQIVASNTVDAPLRLSDAVSVLRSEGHDPVVLDELSAIGAVMCTTNAEVGHETLADYLRACEVYSAGVGPAADRINGITMAPGSLLPNFLVELATTPTLLRAAWGRLLATNLRTYVEALRYQGDLSSHYTSLDVGDASHLLLSDLLDGVSEPIRAFFPMLFRTLASVLTHDHADDLGIVGILSPGLGNLTYSLVPASADANRVEVAFPEPRAGYHGINLGPSNYRLDSGRLIGFERLKQAIGRLVKYRRLTGGPLWANERLIARLRYLEAEYQYPFGGVELLDEIGHMLTSDRERVVGYAHAEMFFPISEMFDDISTLLAAGQTTVDRWWMPHQILDLSQPDTIRSLVDEHWRRAQRIYREVVESSFPAIVEELEFYRALPVRYSVALFPSDFQGIASANRWMPVASWDEAGADIEISSDFIPAPSDHFERARAEFERLGRNGLRALNMTQGPAPRFDGEGFMRFSGETSTLRDAMAMLEADLERIMGRPKLGSGAF